MIDVATLGDDEERFAFDATPDELKALAKRFQVQALEDLHADAAVRAIGGGGARARVTFHASVLQSSVVTLEPVRSRIDEAFEVEFLPRAEGADGQEADSEDGQDLEALEPPGEVTDGRFDLGEMIAEYLSLAIDPYPRQAGEEFGEWHDAAPDGGTQKEGPFAALKNWRSRA
ncbi:MAG: DUF177 domain-containing protein [Actinobacteria bacterium]|nr:DUF177 domain-containing protein [Actinomycetota bacterium]